MGLGSVPLGGLGGGVFAFGRSRWGAGAEGGAGGGELSGSNSIRHHFTPRPCTEGEVRVRLDGFLDGPNRPVTQQELGKAAMG